MLDWLNSPDTDAAATSPSSHRRSRYLVFGAIGVVVIAFVIWLSQSVLFADPTRNLGLEFEKVERGKVTFTIVEKGEVEAYKNAEVKCEVRNRPGANEWIATTIKWLIEDGKQVKTGEVVMRLDDANLKERKRAQEIAVKEQELLLDQAESELEIIKIQNDVTLSTAINTEKIARMNLDGKLKLARVELEQYEEKKAWSSRMVKQGFINETQAKSDEIRVDSAEINLRATELELQSRLEQAEVGVKVARTEGQIKKTKAEAIIKNRTKILEEERAKLAEIEKDIKNCTVIAPSDGMVVYKVSEQSKSGTGSQKGILAVGEPVYEDKTLMQLPDLSKMQVRVKIHESVQPRVRSDVVHENDDGEQEVLRKGQFAEIRVTSLDRVMTGRVTWMSTVASQLDAISSDVRVYRALVTINEKEDIRKPGMTAEVTIFVDEHDDVLRVPVQAVLEAGGEKFCYVKSGRDVKRRVVQTGLNNNRFVEIKSGLEESDLVVQNPRALAEKRGDLNVRR